MPTARFTDDNNLVRLEGALSGTVPATSIGGVTVSGTPSAGQILTATSATAADWEAGGGALAFTGAVIGLTATPGLASGATIPFDRVDADSDSYYDAGNTQLVIPSGKAGVYLVGMLLLVAVTTQTLPYGDVITSGNPANVPIGLGQSASSSFKGSNSAVIGPYSVGDTLVGKVAFTGAGTVDVTGGGNGSLLFCQFLGA